MSAYAHVIAINNFVSKEMRKRINY